MKTSRKNLLELAEKLGAEKVAINICEFENFIESFQLKHNSYKHVIICFSAGDYGNTGRLDYIKTKKGGFFFYY